MNEKNKIYNELKHYLKSECEKFNKLIQKRIIKLFEKDENEPLKCILDTDYFDSNENLKTIILENYIELKRNKIRDIIELFFEFYYEKNKNFLFILWNFKNINNKNLQLEKVINYNMLFNYDASFKYLNFVKCKFNYPTKRIISLLKVNIDL